MIIIYLSAILLVGMILVWMVSSVLDWILFKRIFAEQLSAKLASILASWVILMLLSIGRDPIVLGGYTAAAAAYGALAYRVGLAIRKEEKEAPTVADVFD